MAQNKQIVKGAWQLLYSSFAKSQFKAMQEFQIKTPLRGHKEKSCVLTMTVSCNPLESPVMGCLLDLPSSGKPSGLLDWLWQIELGQQDPADQPDCLDPRCQPGKQPRNGERKKTILRNNAKSILILWYDCHMSQHMVVRDYPEIILWSTMTFFLVINLQNPLKPRKLTLTLVKFI